MTILISHRGNINGRDYYRENEPAYVREALEAGFDVEVDLWVFNGHTFLGHDGAKFDAPLDLLRDNRVWVHCKNQAAVAFCFKQMGDIHYFWHENDHLAITSRGFAWVFPGRKIPECGGIAVKPEIDGWDISGAQGICSDFIQRYK